MGGEFFFFQAEDGIRDLVRSRGLGDVYKRQGHRSGTRALARPWATADGCGRCLVEGDPMTFTNLSLIHI